MLVIGQMPFCQYESARLPFGSAGILGTAQFMRNTFLIEMKVFVASSYRHDEEDAARLGVSQTAAVTKPHIRFPRMDYFVRTKTCTCVVIAHRIGVRTGSKGCSRVLVANCTDIFILSFARESE